MFDKYAQLSLETICRISHELRKSGKSVAFTHAAFDLFHVGHLRLLSDIRKKADYTFVAVESDKNVSSYKTYKRPIIKEEHRLRIVGNIKYVDLAFINREPLKQDTYISLYKEIRPSFVAIGRNYGFEDVMEDQTTRGGTKLIKFDKQPKDIMTTSDIIESVIKRYEVVND